MKNNFNISLAVLAGCYLIMFLRSRIQIGVRRHVRKKLGLLQIESDVEEQIRINGYVSIFITIVAIIIGMIINMKSNSFELLNQDRLLVDLKFNYFMLFFIAMEIIFEKFSFSVTGDAKINIAFMLAAVAELIAIAMKVAWVIRMAILVYPVFAGG